MELGNRLAQTFIPFENNELFIAIEKAYDIKSPDGLRNYFSTPVKCLMLDVGLLNSAYGYSYADFIFLDNDALFNIGNICEQFIGQHLLYAGETFEEPELFYWVREKSQSLAELDYIIFVGPEIIPIEVKSG